MDKAGHEKVLAINFAKFIRQNYQVVKGGGYRHRGDFYGNSKTINEVKLFEIFITYNNDGICRCVNHNECECSYQNMCQECGFPLRK